jgi:hypothetical protein
MSAFASIIRRIPVPGRSPWWLVGAIVLGLMTTLAIGAVVAVINYYPMEIGLQELYGPAVFGNAAIMVMVAGGAYSIASRSGRPIALSLILLLAMLLGALPGAWLHQSLRSHAFHMLAIRSTPLVDAIRAFEQKEGSPPKSLPDLVPRYLPEVPHTGMVAYPNYEYSTGSVCEDDNRWQIVVDAGGVLNWDYFFYCPLGNYPSDIGGDWVEMIEGWAYLHE